MRALFLVIFLAMPASTASAGEMYKCVNDGKTGFQDVPCRGSGAKVSVTPANGGPLQPTDSTLEERPTIQNSALRLRQNVATMENERKQREVAYAIRDLERDIAGYQSEMDTQIAMLQRKKSLAKDNLAGATWEQSISSEMQAVSDTYRMRIQVAQDRIVQLHKEVDDLKRKQ